MLFWGCVNEGFVCIIREVIILFFLVSVFFGRRVVDRFGRSLVESLLRK